MRKAKKIKIGLFSSRNKWARRGRNLAHFTMSLIFYIFAYIFYGIAVIFKCLFYFVSSIISRLFLSKRDLNRLTNKDAFSQISSELPDRFSRLNALMSHLEDKPIQNNLPVGSIIDLTDGCSNDDLGRIVGEAEKIAILRVGKCKKSEAMVICEQDLLAGVNKIKPIVVLK